MFPRNENRNEGTFGCSPGTITGTMVCSHVPPERGHIRQNHPFTKPPFLTNPGTTPITISAVNSDHSLSFAGEETRTMVWVSFSLQIYSTFEFWWFKFFVVWVLVWVSSFYGDGGGSRTVKFLHVQNWGRAKGAAKASCGETVVQKGVFGESVSSLLPCFDPAEA